jgi:hypothetical protein
VLLVILGVQMVSMGLLAEMVLRTYHEVQNKPIYVIRESLGTSENEKGQAEPAAEDGAS